MTDEQNRPGKHVQRFFQALSELIAHLERLGEWVHEHNTEHVVKRTSMTPLEAWLADPAEIRPEPTPAEPTQEATPAEAVEDAQTVATAPEGGEA